MIIVPTHTDMIESSDDSMIIVKGDSIYFLNSSAKELYGIICCKPSIGVLVNEIIKMYNYEWYNMSETIVSETIEALVKLEDFSLISFEY